MMNSKIRQRTKWNYPTKTNGKNKRIKKWFKTLEEAIAFRDDYVAKMNDKGELVLI